MGRKKQVSRVFKLRGKTCRQINSEDLGAMKITFKKNRGNIAATARDLKIPESTIRYWKHHEFAFSNVENRGANHDLAVIKALTTLCLDTPFEGTVSELRQALIKKVKHNVSRATLYRYMKKLDLMSKVPRKKPILTAEKAKERLDHCKALLPVADTTSYFHYYDESSYKVLPPQYRYVTKRGDTIPFTPAAPHPPQVHFAFMYCPATGLRSDVFFLRDKETWTGDRVQEVFEDMFAQKTLKRGHTVLMDNPNTHNKAKKYLAKKGVNLVKHPPMSPDLNPIENLFKCIKAEVKKKAPRTKEGAKRVIQAAWKAYPKEKLKKFTLSAKRLQAVIDVHGYATKY